MGPSQQSRERDKKGGVKKKRKKTSVKTSKKYVRWEKRKKETFVRVVQSVELLRRLLHYGEEC